VPKKKAKPKPTKKVIKDKNDNVLKEYRVILYLEDEDGVRKKKQGPRICNTNGEKLYFNANDRALLNIWVHKAHLLPSSYTAVITGHTAKGDTHQVTAPDVEAQVEKMRQRVKAQSKIKSSVTDEAASILLSAAALLTDKDSASKPKGNSSNSRNSSSSTNGMSSTSGATVSDSN
jgi:hypothetical protein